MANKKQNPDCDGSKSFDRARARPHLSQDITSTCALQLQRQSREKTEQNCGWVKPLGLVLTRTNCVAAMNQLLVQRSDILRAGIRTGGNNARVAVLYLLAQLAS